MMLFQMTPTYLKEYQKERNRYLNVVKVMTLYLNDAVHRVSTAKKTDSLTVRRMFCKCIESLINICMSLHDFTFNGKVYRQEKCGAIGLDLVGVVASIYMDHWHKKLIEILLEERIFPKMYKRYVDNIDLILKVGNSSLKSEEEVMKFIQIKANTIDKNIQVT